MRTCQVPDCGREATAGEDWRQPPLNAVEVYRLGTQLRLAVTDTAVSLLLCEDHARELATAGWQPVLDLLDRWGWQPLPPQTARE
jgi:hypothetical protein